MDLQQKRKQALKKLQSNRGKSKLELESLSRAVKESRDLFIEEEEEDDDAIELAEIFDVEEIEREDREIVNLENLPKIAKAQEKVAKQQAKIRESAQRLKKTREKVREVRQKRQKQTSESENQAITKTDDDEETIKINRHQLKEDLLTADFWQQASQWLSSINTDIHLSSTPAEEVELLYKQVKHRYQALQLMLEDTQKELDAFEVYFRNLESSSHLNNKYSE